MLRTLSSAERDEFRAALLKANYTTEGVTSLLGSLEAPAEHDLSFTRMLYLTRKASPLDVCVRLFLNSVPADVEQVRRALDPFPVDRLEAMGLVRVEGVLVMPLVTLMPVQGVYLIFDIPVKIGEGAKPDHVVGITLSAMHVHNAMIQRPSRRTLDVGTGCGNLAFSAAPFSDEVYGVDCNPRALNFAKFGSWLNRCENVTLLEGDAFAPVAGREFDLVVANLPFVLAPSMRYQYRDGGMRADQFARRIAREAPGVLAPGGFAQLLCQWAHVKGEDWRNRLTKWFEGLACDVLVLRLEESETSAYAERWIRDTEPWEIATSGSTFEQWMSYYEAEGIEAVSSGLITMRRSGGSSNWLRIEEIPRTFDSSYGGALLRRFELIDFSEAAKSLKAMLQKRLRAAPDLRLVQTNAPGDGKWKPLSAEMRLTNGLHYEGNVDPMAANLITQCNGIRTVEEVLHGLSKLAGVEPDRLADRYLAVVKELVSRGFLLPAE